MKGTWLCLQGKWWYFRFTPTLLSANNEIHIGMNQWDLNFGGTIQNPWSVNSWFVLRLVRLDHNWPNSFALRCYIFTMVNCTYLSRNSSHIIQFHLKVWQLFVYNFYHVHNCKLELSMQWTIWMVRICSKFLRITDKAYFLCISLYSVHSYENNTDTVTTLQINLSLVCSTVIDNLQCRPQWVTNLVHLKYWIYEFG